MVYGPGEHPSKYRNAIINFIHSALKGEKLTVHRGAKRAWCYISDFICGLYVVMQHSFSGKYEAFNIGTDEYHTMEEVAKIVVNECNADSNQIRIIEPPSKFLSLAKEFSIDRIRSIGYEPKISLKEGIHRVAEWQRKEIHSKKHH
jgi:nucleoside-diphosphate-sugar epimerase